MKSFLTDENDTELKWRGRGRGISERIEKKKKL